MHFSTLFTAALVPAASLASLVARDAATVEKDIAALVTDIATLNNTVVAFKGAKQDLGGALKLQIQASTLQNQIQQTTKDVTASQPFSDDETTTIALSLLNAEPDILNLLQNFENKRALADNGPIPLSGLVLLNLKAQKNATIALGAALQDKLQEPYKDVTPLVIAELTAKFDEAIANYTRKA